MSVNDSAFQVAYALRTGVISADRPILEACCSVVMAVNALKSMGRTYGRLCIVVTKDDVSFTISKVHHDWTVYTANRLTKYMAAYGATFQDALGKIPVDQSLCLPIAGGLPLELVLQQASEDDGAGPSSTVSCSAPGLGPHACKLCGATYGAAVNAARCEATHPPKGRSRQAYDGAAVARFWDETEYGTRLDILESVRPFVSSLAVELEGEELLAVMEGPCENLLLTRLFREPRRVPERLKRHGDVLAETCYRVVAEVVRAMEAAAAAKQLELLDMVASEAARETAREAERQAKRDAKRQAKVEARRKTLVARLTTDDAYFRAFVPGGRHWCFDDDEPMPVC
jgi:hypothetical protein